MVTSISKLLILMLVGSTSCAPVDDVKQETGDIRSSKKAQGSIFKRQLQPRPVNIDKSKFFDINSKDFNKFSKSSPHRVATHFEFQKFTKPQKDIIDQENSKNIKSKKNDANTDLYIIHVDEKSNSINNNENPQKRHVDSSSGNQNFGSIINNNNQQFPNFINNAQLSPNPFLTGDFGNTNSFGIALSSLEDIHTDSGISNSFGIPLLSNDGMSNQNPSFQNSPPINLNSPNILTIIDDQNQQSNSVSFGNSLTGSNSQSVGISLPGAFDQSSSTNSFISNNGSVGIPLFENVDSTGSNNNFQNFGLEPVINNQGSSNPLLSSVQPDSFEVTLSQGNPGVNLSPSSQSSEIILPDFSLQSSSEIKGSSNVNKNSPPGINNNADPFSFLNLLQGNSPDTNAINNILSDSLGGLTIGDLLNGINGQNGIVVMPMSEAKKDSQDLFSSFNINSDFSNNLLNGKSLDNSDTTEASTTTAPETTTRRRRRQSRRRTTTKPPDHIRVSLSDLLYAKGQWLGTILGGLIDLGRIAMDAFKANNLTLDVLGGSSYHDQSSDSNYLPPPKSTYNIPKTSVVDSSDDTTINFAFGSI